MNSVLQSYEQEGYNACMQQIGHHCEDDALFFRPMCPYTANSMAANAWEKGVKRYLDNIGVFY